MNEPLWHPAARDVVRFEWYGKYRTGVVIRTDGEWGHVLYCTSQAHPIEPFALIEPESRHGRALALSLRSYFYPRNLAAVRLKDLARKCGPCPRDLYLRLVEIAAHGVARVE